MPVRLLRITTVPQSLHLLLNGQMEFMQQHGYDVLAVSAEGPEVDVVKKKGIAHTVVPMTRSITPLRDLVALWRLIIICRTFKPLIVHTHTPKAGLLGMLAAWICRIPVRLHTVAGLPLMESAGLKKKILIATERITYACASYVYPNSQGLKTYIMNNIASDDGKFSVIGKGSSNGINTKYFSCAPEIQEKADVLRRENNVAPGTIVFCFVGRIVKDKGINELLSAFDRLSREHPVRLMLVGPMEDSLDPISEASRVIMKENSNVIYLGHQNDVRPALQASDVFVFPSYREGFPNVLLQAGSMELPCIASNINGCNEIVQHGVSGFLIEPKTVDPLYDAMLSLAFDEPRRKQFGAHARKYIETSFDQAYIWTELLNEYKRTTERVQNAV